MFVSQILLLKDLGNASILANIMDTAFSMALLSTYQSFYDQIHIAIC